VHVALSYEWSATLHNGGFAQHLLFVENGGNSFVLLFFFATTYNSDDGYSFELFSLTTYNSDYDYSLVLFFF
jgi:hypothetical protein